MKLYDPVTVGYVQAAIFLIQTAIVGITLGVLVYQLRKLSEQTDLQRKVAIGKAADRIYQDWWGPEIRGLRKYFFLEFVPKHLKVTSGHNLKEVEIIVSEDRGRTASLCFFFDRIGWLGAAGLIDVDYVLAPMQHTLRRVWTITEPLIRTARVSMLPHFDPVYLYGFEWLVLRSEQVNRHQVDLLRRRFSDPMVLDDLFATELRANIQRDEAEYALQFCPNSVRSPARPY